MSEAQFDPAVVNEVLERVLASREFSTTARMRRFLEHVVRQKMAGNVADLKESLIGVSVFDREPGYDPKTDAIVRVEARRLRAKLAEYYEASGSTDPIRIVFPKGSYIPEFVPETAAPPAVQPTPEAIPVLAAPARTFAIPSLLRWGLAAGLAVFGIVLGYLKSSAPESERVRPLTSLPGYERKPHFSPDGQSIAFGWAGPDQTTTRIYVQRLGSDNAVPLTTGLGNDVSAAWSPDGATIAFLRQNENDQWDVMTIPANGGPERKLAHIVARASTELNLSWDPDARYLLTSTRRDASAPPSLVRINLASGQPAPIAGSQPGDCFPNISPDGKTLAFFRYYTEDVADLMTASWTNGAIDRTRKLTPERSIVAGFDWLNDGRSLVYSSERRGGAQLWRIGLDGGEPKLIPAAAVEALTPTVSRRSAQIAWVHRFRDINIWSASNDGATKRLIVGSTAEDMDPAFSPDGKRIVFRSNRSGSTEVWTAARDGSSQRKLTSFEGARVRDPRWSPDGKRIVFVAIVAGTSHAYTIPADGGAPSRLFQSRCNQYAPSWSRDGHYIYYASECDGRSQIRKRALEGGDEITLVADGGTAPIEHTDGSVYYFKNGIWRMARDGGAPELVLAGMPESLWGNWAPGDGGIFHLKYLGLTGPSVIQFFDFATHSDRDVFTMAQLPVRWSQSLAVSPDRRELLFAQLDQAGADILLLENLR